MKNRNFKKTSIGLLLPVAMSLGVLFGTYKAPAKQANAYTAVSNLPTTIDLNDNTETQIRSYYSSLNNLNDVQRRGTNLLKNLKGILKNGQKYYSYESGTNVWRLYEITDRDWEKSPANEIPSGYGTYDEQTNTITGYKYGSSVNDNKGSNPYLHALYVDRTIDNPIRAWDYHGRSYNNIGIDREHIWPKSQGFETSGAGGARGDPMHLVAAESFANGKHSAYSFGNVDRSKEYSVSEATISKNNILGTAKRSGVSGTVFEPQDSDKGDIARALFYMAARYNTYDGDTAIDSNNPNLILDNTVTGGNDSGYTSTTTTPGSYGVISDLLEWNKLDPVDEYERHRNNLLYNNFTNNRNPFIDFPEWADLIWGNASGYATPNSDPINGGTITKTVTKIEVTTQPNNVAYSSGQTFSTTGMVVKATYSDGTASNITNYTFSPSGALSATDTQITISYEGKTTYVPIYVSGSGGGTTTVTKTFTFDFYDADKISETTGTDLKSENYSQFITVDSDLSVSDVVTAVTTTNTVQFAKNGGLTLGSNSKTGTVTFTIGADYAVNKVTLIGTLYDNDEKITLDGTFGEGSLNSKETILAECENSLIWDNLDRKTSLSFSSNAKRATIYQIVCEYSAEEESSVIPVSNVSLDITTISSMEVGERRLLTETVTPEDATNKNVTWESDHPEIVSVENGEITALSAGDARITVSTLDGNHTATCNVHVNNPVVLTSIEIDSLSTQTTEFYLGDEFNTDGIIVNAIYSDSHEEDVTEEAEFSGYNMQESGSQTVTVSYGGKTTTYSITVKENSLGENTISFLASQSGAENGEDAPVLVDSSTGISVNFAKGTGSNPPKFYTSGSSFRLYSNNTITVTNSINNIVKIEFIFGSSDGNNTITANGGAYTETNGVGTWVGSASSVIFNISSLSNNNRRISAINITYDPNSSATVTLSSITASGYKTNYKFGEAFSTQGLSITAHYSDGTTSSLQISDVSITGYNPQIHGEQTITISYTESNNTATTSYNVSVTKIIQSIALSGSYKTTFYQGGNFDHTNMVVTATYSDTTTGNVTSSAEFSGYNLSTTGQQTVTVTVDGINTYYSITVESDALSSVSVDKGTAKTTFMIGDTFTRAGATATAHYLSGKEVDVTNVARWTEPTLTETGTKQVRAYYSEGGVEKYGYYSITINKAVLVYTFEITAADFDKTSYAANDNEKTSIATCTTDPTKSISIKWSSSNVMKKGDLIQFKSNAGYIYNSTNLEKITSIVIDSDGSFTTTYGNEEKPSGTTVGGGYFKILGGADTPKASKITVSFEMEKQVNVTLDHIELNDAMKVSFPINSEFTTEGLVVTAYYSDLSSKSVTPTAVSTPDMSVAGSQTITVTYTEGSVTKIATYDILIFEATYFYKVTDLSQLQVGQKIIIGHESGQSLICMPNSFTDLKPSGISLGITDNYVANYDSPVELEIASFSYSDESVSISLSNGSAYLNCPSSSTTNFAYPTSINSLNIKTSDKGDFLIYKDEHAIIYRAGDYNRFGSYSMKNVSETSTEYFGVSIYAAEITISPSSYSLVRNFDDLKTGDEIIFAGESNGNYYAMDSFNSSSNVYNTDLVNEEYFAIDPLTTTTKVTIVKDENGFGFNTPNGFIAATTSTAAGIRFESSQSRTEDSYFDITINQDGTISICSQTSKNVSKYLRFNSSNSWISMYTTEYSQPVSIFKKHSQVEADNWAKSFLNDTYNCNKDSWSTYAASYQTLSSEAKQELATVFADQDSNFCWRGQAMARYEYMLSDARFSQGLKAFITDRGITPTQKIDMINIVGKIDASTIIIVALSAAGVAALGGYFVFKRRKEQY